MAGKGTPFDTGNPLLNDGPALMTVAPVEVPDGPRWAVTIRTSSATVTAVLTQEDAGNWRDMLGRAAARPPATGSGLIVAGGDGAAILG